MPDNVNNHGRLSDRIAHTLNYCGDILYGLVGVGVGAYVISYSAKHIITAFVENKQVNNKKDD